MDDKTKKIKSASEVCSMLESFRKHNYAHRDEPITCDGVRYFLAVQKANPNLPLYVRTVIDTYLKRIPGGNKNFLDVSEAATESLRLVESLNKF